MDKKTATQIRKDSGLRGPAFLAKIGMSVSSWNQKRNGSRKWTPENKQALREISENRGLLAVHEIMKVSGRLSKAVSEGRTVGVCPILKKLGEINDAIYFLEKFNTGK